MAIDQAMLGEALRNGELTYYYQPKISLINGKICGSEALMRWVRPDGELVQPGEFIPIAESTGFITELSLGMFPRLVEDLLIINDYREDTTTSFNLSAQDFREPAMVNAIRDAIEHHCLDPARIEVELTEDSVLHWDNLTLRKHLNQLVELGVSLSMDDYGTGYASIDTLSQWPFDCVKLDQGLIGRMSDSTKATTIVQASIRMAHQLGLRIVAEGIETSALYDFLLNSGCTHAQGYWLASPQPLDEYLKLLGKDQRWSGLPTGLIHMATLDHIHWRQALIAEVMAIAFQGAQTDLPVRTQAPELDPHQCRLGRWYYGPGQEFRDHPLFRELEEPHFHLHQLGRQLLEAARNGLPRTALVTQLRQLTRQSAIVLELLQELESEALLDHLHQIQLGDERLHQAG
jgi:EAL domain-containing protein (putative c-di-GMP-specific phosphodiesterase class I)